MSDIYDAKLRADRAAGDAWLDEAVPSMRLLLTVTMVDEEKIADAMLPMGTRSVAMAALLRLARTTDISADAALNLLA